LHLGDHVQVPAGVELHVDHAERFQPGPELRAGAPHPLGHRAHLPVAAGQQRDDPVGLTQLVGAQHDRLVPVELHLPIVTYRTDKPAAGARWGDGAPFPSTSPVSTLGSAAPPGWSDCSRSGCTSSAWCTPPRSGWPARRRWPGGTSPPPSWAASSWSSSACMPPCRYPPDWRSTGSAPGGCCWWRPW